MKKFNLQDFILDPKENLAKRIIYHDENVIAFVLNIGKGAALPDHTHFDCTVLLKVIKGTGKLNLADQTISIVQNDLIELDGPEKMSVDNTGEETLVLYVTISPIPPSEKYITNIDF